MDSFYDPFYKGCTSPSTAFGIPMLPLILGSVVFVEAGVVLFFVGGMPLVVMLTVVYGFAFSWARTVSRHDEQRLLQLLLRLRIRLRQRASVGHWGAVSFGPVHPPVRRRRLP